MTDIAIVGEAWGEEEAKQRTPFIGSAGYALTQMLDEAGISRAECFLTNTFNLHPPGNKVEWFCGPKSEGISGYPALVKGKHVRQEFIPELERLGDELTSVNPNIIIALGNTASWALLGRTAISKYRGTTELSTHTARDFKVLSTYHPSYILRGQWDQRPVVILDLIKAKRESEFPEIRRPAVSVHIPETLEDLYGFELRIRESVRVAVDIETSGNQVTCIGFAIGSACTLVIPFVDPRKKNRSYWPDDRTESAVWRWIKSVMGDRTIQKCFQNGCFDVAFLWRAYGVATMGATEDTMLAHHSLQPESLKGLGFLGSIYTDFGSWKTMRSHKTTIKLDE